MPSTRDGYLSLVTCQTLYQFLADSEIFRGTPHSPDYEPTVSTYFALRLCSRDFVTSREFVKSLFYLGIS